MKKKKKSNEQNELNSIKKVHSHITNIKLIKYTIHGLEMKYSPIQKHPIVWEMFCTKKYHVRV